MRLLLSGLTRRRLVLGGGGVISAGLAGGCVPFVGGGAVAQPTAVKAKGPVALTLHHRWDGELREPAVESQLREFRQTHPHVTVSVTVGREAAVVTSAAGAGADVGMLHSNEAAVVAGRGGLL